MPNISTAKICDVLGHTKSYTHFCPRVNNPEFQQMAITHEIFDGMLEIKKIWIMVQTVTDSVHNISTTKTHDVLGHTKSYTHFCPRFNNPEFQQKAITHEFFDGMQKIEKLWIMVQIVIDRVPNVSTT